jgi:hypothetical protein
MAIAAVDPVPNPTTVPARTIFAASNATLSFNLIPRSIFPIVLPLPVLSLYLPINLPSKLTHAEIMSRHIFTLCIKDEVEREEGNRNFKTLPPF